MKKWKSRLEHIDYAFQPIVNIHTGNAFGFEALLRCHRKAGFVSIDDLFNKAHEDGLLHNIDLILRKKALKKFSLFKRKSNSKLFYNLDNRLFDAKRHMRGNTLSMLEEYAYSKDDICFEISEKHPFYRASDVTKVLGAYRSQGFKIAVDDCGTGFSGLQLLYYAEPDYIKIDRFFIQNLEKDSKKRLVVSTIVNIAHLMGSLVLAEGVETIEEFRRCKDIGCDMVQGYFIQPPVRNLKDLRMQYEIIGNISRSERRNEHRRSRFLISEKLVYIPPVSSDTDIITVFDKFRQEEETSFFPVINRLEEPLGVIRDSAFKDYIFSKFGRQLLENPSFGKNMARFIARIPIADIHSPIEQLIETYTHFNNNEGLIMVNDMKYVGMLSTKSLLKIINEKNLMQARNQNPLTHLPGNTMIYEYFSKCLADIYTTYHLIYFDFDNFKPFNDRYGFRNGDRLIIMFADMLKSYRLSDQQFVGHVGGDDFFLGITEETISDVVAEMTSLAFHFRKNAESFYDQGTREKGYMIAEDREGRTRKIPLITVSVAVLELPSAVADRGVDRACSVEKAANIISVLKQQAKVSPSGLVSASILDFLHPPQSARPAGNVYSLK